MSDVTVKFLRQELGVFQLVRDYCRDDFEEFTKWFFNESEIDYLLDAVEFVFRICPHIGGQWAKYPDNVLSKQIDLFNARMMEASVGYQFESGQIIQMTDQLIHKEIVIPALSLISQPRFKVVQDEFLQGHRSLRSKDYEQCLIECHKSLESTLKIISAERNWGTSENANAGVLISAAFTSGFIPEFMQSQFSALRSMLDSAVPTIRNKSAAHGQGNNPRKVSSPLARFQLNQTAVAIRFLIDLDEDA